MRKKGLALALAAVLVWAAAVPAFAMAEEPFPAVPAFAIAEEPFPDVPRDHWAYEAVETLRQAGLIEGYPDGTFGGERTFTRYEMAMVFSRILERLMAWLEGQEALLITEATGKVLEALAKEFAPELEELGVTQADLSQILLAMNARIQALDQQVAALVQAARKAQAQADEAAQAAARAEDRAYRARLAAEQARAQANEATSLANRALSIALMSVGVDEATAESLLAEQSVEAIMEAVRSATGEDAALALAQAEQASERAYRARLAAEQARALANEAREIAERGLAIAEMAYNNPDVKNALETAQQAADRAYRARLAAEQARALANEARELAERALAIAEIQGGDALEAAKAAQEAVQQAREAAQRAQQLAVDAQTAAMLADAKADLAREEAAESLAVAREAYQLASDAMNEAIRQGELAREEARRAMELAQQADRLAFLAFLSAERALERIDEVQEQVAALQLRPVLGGEVRADFEETYASDAEGVPLDPRDSDSDTIKTDSKFTTSVALNATVEPAEGVVVQGGLKLSATVFGNEADDDKLTDLYVKVTTPGVIRSAYFGGVTGAQLAEGFSKYVLHSSKLSGNRGGAIIEAQLGSLSARIIATRPNNAPNNSQEPNDSQDVYGIAATLPLEQGLTVGVDYAYQGETNRTTALRAYGETAGLSYDWTYAIYQDDTAIDGKLSTKIGAVDLGFNYYSVGAKFGQSDQLGKELSYKDDGIESDKTAYKLTASLPLSFGTAVYEKGYDAKKSDPAGEFVDSHLAGLKDVNVFGFELAGYYYTDERDEGETTAYRFDVSRTVQLGLPLTFSVSQANISLRDWSSSPFGDTAREYLGIGVALNDYALTETITLNAGYKTERNPIKGDWKKADEWLLKLEDDTAATFEVAKRDTASVGVALAATENLTLKAAYELAQHETARGDVARSKTDLGADYKFSLLGADVTLGYAYQIYEFDGADFVFNASPRTTYTVGISKSLFGGTVDAQYKLVTGRGSDGAGKVDARDMTASVNYTYPIADSMNFTLSGKWGSSQGNADAADDYYYASVKAGVGLKF